MIASQNKNVCCSVPEGEGVVVLDLTDFAVFYVYYETYVCSKTSTSNVHGGSSILSILIPYSAGIDLSRQNLTSVDVRFWRLMSTPAL